MIENTNHFVTAFYTASRVPNGLDRLSTIATILPGAYLSRTTIAAFSIPSRTPRNAPLVYRSTFPCLELTFRSLNFLSPRDLKDDSWESRAHGCGRTFGENDRKGARTLGYPVA